jgi:hypothetical protein
VEEFPATLKTGTSSQNNHWSQSALTSLGVVNDVHDFFDVPERAQPPLAALPVFALIMQTQTATYLTPSSTLPPLLPSVDSLRASVSHLLSRAYSLPCSTAAQAFSQLVQPTARFQLALDALLPLLDTPAEVSASIYSSSSIRILSQLNVSLRNESLCLIFCTHCMRRIRSPLIHSNPYYLLPSSKREIRQLK